jgi:transposase
MKPPACSPTGHRNLTLPDAKPRFKPINRKQNFLRAVDIESPIGENHAARAIWSVVKQLDLSGFSEQARVVEGSAGRATIDPHLLASQWIYAYSQGVGSAREISRLCAYHPAYQWLTGAEEISGHTISDFRVEHQAALEKLFVEVIGVLSAEGFVKLNRVMQDGTRIRAHAADDSFRRRQTTTAAVGKAIVSLDVTQDGNDFQQLAPAIRPGRADSGKQAGAGRGGRRLHQRPEHSRNPNQWSGIDWTGDEQRGQSRAVLGTSGSEAGVLRGSISL